MLNYFKQSPLHRFCFIFIVIGIIGMITPILIWLIDSPIRIQSTPYLPTYKKTPLSSDELTSNEKNIHYESNCVIKEASTILNRYNEFETDKDRKLHNDPSVLEILKSKIILEKIAKYPLIHGNLVDPDTEKKHLELEKRIYFFNDKIIAYLREKCGYKLQPNPQQYKTEKTFSKMQFTNIFRIGFWILVAGLIIPLTYSAIRRLWIWIISGT